MGFTKIINRKKFTLISMFLFLYFLINLLDGERGLISYFENKNIKSTLLQEKEILTLQLASVEKKNRLLTEELDLDYLEILYRKKLMLGKSEERIFVSE